MRTQTYKKLVRDLIPEIIRGNGGEPTTRVLSEEDYKKALLEKIVEEADEVMTAPLDELEKEIGDVYEVIEGIIEAFDLSRENIERIQTERREKRGAFKERIWLESVEE